MSVLLAGQEIGAKPEKKISALSAEKAFKQWFIANLMVSAGVDIFSGESG